MRCPFLGEQGRSMQDQAVSAFREILGDRFEGLPPLLQRVHDHNGHLLLTGRATARIFLWPIGPVICWFMGFPATGEDIAVAVEFNRLTKGRETWHRNFHGRHYVSRLRAGRGRDAGLLVETLGSMTVMFRLDLELDRLKLEVVGCKFLGLRLPRILSPRCVAFESERNGHFLFDIDVRLPFLGRLIAYRGDLTP